MTFSHLLFAYAVTIFNSISNYLKNYLWQTHAHSLTHSHAQTGNRNFFLLLLLLLLQRDTSQIVGADVPQCFFCYLKFCIWSTEIRTLWTQPMCVYNVLSHLKQHELIARRIYDFVWQSIVTHTMYSICIEFDEEQVDGFLFVLLCAAAGSTIRMIHSK